MQKKYTLTKQGVRRLGDRFREHLRDVERNDKDASKLVAGYFNLPDHSSQHMTFCGLSLHQDNTESRKNQEQKFHFSSWHTKSSRYQRTLFVQLIHACFSRCHVPTNNLAPLQPFCAPAFRFAHHSWIAVKSLLLLGRGRNRISFGRLEIKPKPHRSPYKPRETYYTLIRSDEGLKARNTGCQFLYDGQFYALSTQLFS